MQSHVSASRVVIHVTELITDGKPMFGNAVPVVLAVVPTVTVTDCADVPLI
jgi:hypothetical protein